MHITFVPITDDDRLCAKDIIGGPPGLRKWQDEYFEVTLGINERVMLNDELKTLRKYVKSIPEDIKGSIDEHNRNMRKQRNKSNN